MDRSDNEEVFKKGQNWRLWIPWVIIIISLFFMSLSSYSQAELRLTWNASTDNVGVTGYNVWLDGLYHGTTSDTFFYFSLAPGTYAMAVSAFDAAGNESDLSEVLMVEVEDKTPPTIPDSLLLLYPNPTYGDFRLAITREVHRNSMIRIMTPTGQILYQRSVKDYNSAHVEEFNMEQLLVEGIYIVDLVEDGVRTGRAHLIILESKKKILSANSWFSHKYPLYL